MRHGGFWWAGPRERYSSDGTQHTHMHTHKSKFTFFFLSFLDLLYIYIQVDVAHLVRFVLMGFDTDATRC
jgi:hypothetical protein